MTPTTKSDLTTNPPSITSTQLHAFILKRERFRARIKTAFLGVVVLAICGFVTVWTLFHKQFMAKAALESKGFAVIWVFDSKNFMRGGETEVRSIRSSWNSRTVNSSGGFGQADLTALKDLMHLHDLDLSGLYEIREADLEVLPALTELRDLQLDRSLIANQMNIPQLDDRAMNYVKDSKNLRSLGLSYNKITDRGVAMLANLSQLETLDLDGTEVTDACLETLKKLPKLRHVSLQNTKVTAEGARKFQVVRSDVEVTLVNPVLSSDNQQ
jgi:Leucine-rich repeat (LRR) protein